MDPATLTAETFRVWHSPNADLFDGDEVVVQDADGAIDYDPVSYVATQQVSVTNQDNDVAGFVLSKTTAMVSESGTTDTFTVVLTARPLSNVVFDVRSGDTDEVTADPAQLAFAPDDWGQPQFVTVTGVDDSPATVDDDQVVAVTVSVNDVSSDDARDALADQQVSVTNQDNDVAGFVLSKTTATVSENGTTDTFTAVLTARPLSNVVFDVRSGDTDEVTPDPRQLTFTPTDWDQPQIVTLTGADDYLPDGDQTTAVTLSVDAAAVLRRQRRRRLCSPASSSARRNGVGASRMRCG